MLKVYENTIYLAPVPASRPRVTRYGTYYGKRYQEWKTQAPGFFRSQDKNLFPSGPLKATVNIICKRPQRPSSDIPNGDIDNYVKAALDAVNEAQIWGDDRQVTSLVVSKRYALPGEEPRTHILIQPKPTA